MVKPQEYFVGKMLRRFEKSDAEKLAGKALPAGVTAQKDIPYCNDNVRGHLLDVYWPEIIDHKLPVVIDIHGGGFMSSYKELNRLFGYHLAKRGFLVFNLNYRLAYYDTKVPGLIGDIAMATHWISEHLEQYNGDRGKVFLSGHSAGGVLAVMEALIAVNLRIRQLFQIADGGFERYQGLVLDCGMMFFYKKSIGYWGMRTMCFDRGYLKQAYYQNMIWNQIPEIRSLPKTFLISNAKDELRQMTLDFKKVLEQNHVEHTMNFQAGKALGHMAVIYNPGLTECSEVLDEMTAYLLN